MPTNHLIVFQVQLNWFKLQTDFRTNSIKAILQQNLPTMKLALHYTKRAILLTVCNYINAIFYQQSQILPMSVQ